MNKRIRNVAHVAIVVLIAFTFNLHLSIYMFNTQAGFQIGWEDGNYAYYDHHNRSYHYPTLYLQISAYSIKADVRLLAKDWNGQDDPSPHLDIVSISFQAFGDGKYIAISTENGGSITWATTVGDNTTVVVYNIWWGFYISEPSG